MTPALVLAEVSLRDVWNREILDLAWSAGEEMVADSQVLETSTAAAGLSGAELLGASPNPFAASTVIRFRLEEPSKIVLEIFDVSGRLVQSESPGQVSAGVHAIQWDGTSSTGEDVRSGLYFYRLHVGDRVVTSKLHLQR